MEMPVIPPERKEDIRGLEHLDDAELILLMAGNQFMVMDELIEETGMEKIFCARNSGRLFLRKRGFHEFEKARRIYEKYGFVR